MKISYNKKTKNAWAFYDWANSVYPLVISSTLFPMFYESISETHSLEQGLTETLANGDLVNYVSFMGMKFINTEIYSYVIAASLLLVVILSPMLSGIADSKGLKKRFLKLFCYLGSFATATLFFFDMSRLEFGMLSLFLASLGYWSSIVFYNSFLPELAPPEEHDKLSAKGYSLGYGGSVLLLVVLLFVVYPTYGIRWCFPIVGVWWILFSQYTFKNLPEFKPEHIETTKSGFKDGFREIKKVFNDIVKTQRLRRYLIAFFVFSMGVQTVMMMAQFFGMKEIERVNELGEIVIGLSTNQLITSILALQIVAIPGAFFFSWLADKWSNKVSLISVLFIWILVCVYAYLMVNTPNEFYITAGLIGFIMGGTQSLSRSTYSKYLPETEDHASYFSFYDVLEKIGIVIGMVSFGAIERFTGSMRASVLSLVVFFAFGIILMFFVPKKEKIISSN